MGRTEIAGFRPKSYKNLQAKARKTANFSNKIRDFRIVQAELFTGGVDYLISNNRWRGTVGVARKLSKSYVGVDLGFGLRGEGMDLGLSVGGAAK